MEHVLTGFRPTGRLHLGNYAGAIKPARKYASETPSCKLAVLCADLHALDATTLDIQTSMRELCKLFPENQVVFQSECTGTPVLYTRMMNHISLAELMRNHAVKAVGNAPVNAALLTYPVLMAADCYGYDKVIVGHDQKQHLEIVRDVIGRFDPLIGLPEALILNSEVLLGTDGYKMSKSKGNTIPLFGTAEEIHTLYKSIKTDSKTVEEPKDPNDLICQYMRVLELDTTAYIAGGIGYGQAKKILADAHLNIFGDTT